MADYFHPTFSFQRPKSHVDELQVLREAKENTKVS